jgi:predicted nucleic acid-binding protein
MEDPEREVLHVDDEDIVIPTREELAQMKAREEREIKDFWEEQDRLPLLKRDSIWWWEVAGPRAFFWLVGVGLVVAVAVTIVKALT